MSVGYPLWREREKQGNRRVVLNVTYRDTKWPIDS